jgi:DNA-binding CsgD family transcriptional regulator
MDGERVSATIGAIYDAAVSPDMWPMALEQLSGIFRCNIATIIDRNLETLDGRAIAVGIDDAGQREYFDVWRDRNIFVQRTQVWQPGAIITDQEILPKSDLIASDYYNGFMKPRDMHGLLRISLGTEGGVHQSISLMRPRSSGEYERSDIALGRIFLPHLQRSAAIAQHFVKSRIISASAAELLEDNPTGIIFVEQAGTTVFANRSAHMMAARADSFLLRQGRIEVMRQSDRARFEQLIAGACGQDPRATAARGGAMRLARKSGLRDYLVVVAPLARRLDLFSGLSPVACILITDPEAAPTRPRALLRQLYGLTATEVLIAERLVMGDRPERAAAALGAKVSTVRAHLASLFRKTGTSRQSEVIRLLLSLPWRDGQER